MKPRITSGVMHSVTGGVTEFSPRGSALALSGEREGEMRLRVLALPRYGPLGASSRLRTLQYLPALRAAGLEVDVHPLLDDQYIDQLYHGRISRWRVARAFLARTRDLLRSRQYDVVWTEKELFPWLPSLIERAILPARTKLVVDYDDAAFHRYDIHSSWLVRRLLGRKIDAVMRRADLVVVGNEYLASRARQAGSRRVEWVPTVVDLDRYPVCDGAAERRDSADIVIGWIGSPATAPYLKLVAPALEALRSRHAIRCVAIGARPDQVAGTPFEPREWHEEDEVARLRELDIGIMPLPDGPWERGKCGYKLIQYMASGLPVVASAIGVNNDIVTPGENGYLANSTPEWIEHLSRLIADASLRQRLGLAGRERVTRCYSLQVQAPRLVNLLQETATGNHLVSR